jgi:hypothetical protein
LKIAHGFSRGFGSGNFSKSRKGRKVLAHGHRFSAVPAGTLAVGDAKPSHKWLGYFHNRPSQRGLLRQPREFPTLKFLLEDTSDAALSRWKTFRSGTIADGRQPSAAPLKIVAVILSAESCGAARDSSP